MRDELIAAQSPLESEEPSSLPTLASLPEAYELGETPRELRCPLTQQPFQDPVIGPAGSYERNALAQWLCNQEKHRQNLPKTPLPTEDNDLVDALLARHGYVRNYRLKELLAATSESAYSSHLFKESTVEEDPGHFFCPLSQDWMAEPVVAMDGQSYDRLLIEQYFDTSDNPRQVKSPVVNKLLSSCTLYPNLPLRYLLEQRQHAHYAQIKTFLADLCVLKSRDEQVSLLAKNSDLLILPLPAQENFLHCLLQEGKGLDLLPLVLTAFEQSHQATYISQFFAQKNDQGHSPLDKAILRLQAEASKQGQETNPQQGYAALATHTFPHQENLLHLLARYRAVETLSDVMGYLGEHAHGLFKQPNSEGKIPFDLLSQAFDNSEERLQLLYAIISIIKSTRQPELYRPYLDRCGELMNAFIPSNKENAQEHFYTLQRLAKLIKCAGEFAHVIAGIKVTERHFPSYFCSLFMRLLSDGAANHFSLLYRHMSTVTGINELIFAYQSPANSIPTIKDFIGSSSLPLLKEISDAHRKEIIQMRDDLGRSAIGVLVIEGKCSEVKDYQSLFCLSNENLFHLLIDTDGQSVFQHSYFWKNHRKQFPAIVTEHLSYPLVHRLLCHRDNEGYSALHTLFDIYTTEKEIHDLFGWLNQQDKPGENTALKLLCLQNTQNYSTAICNLVFGENLKVWFYTCLTFFSPNDILTLVTAPSDKSKDNNFFTLCLFDSELERIDIAKKIIETTPHFLDLFANISPARIGNRLLNACKKNSDIAQLVIQRLQHTSQLLSKEQRLALYRQYKNLSASSQQLSLNDEAWAKFLNPESGLMPSAQPERVNQSAHASLVTQVGQTNSGNISGNPKQPPSHNSSDSKQPDVISSSAQQLLVEKTSFPPLPTQKVFVSYYPHPKKKKLPPFRDCTLPLSLASTFLAAGITFSLLGIGATATVFALPLAPKFFAIAGACFAVGIAALSLTIISLAASYFYRQYCSSMFFEPPQSTKVAMPTTKKTLPKGDAQFAEPNNPALPSSLPSL